MVTPLQSTKAESVGAALANLTEDIAPPLSIESVLVTTVPAAEAAITEPPEQLDPLGSPHPIPWNWVMTTYADVRLQRAGLRYYRSPSLVSPDGKYAAYSRMQMQVQPELYRSRLSSVIFVENLQIGELQVINANSPLADNPFEWGKLLICQELSRF